jgi:hypothetical protein
LVTTELFALPKKTNGAYFQGTFALPKKKSKACFQGTFALPFALQSNGSNVQLS